MSQELQVSETVDRITAFIGQQEQNFVKLNESSMNRLNFWKEAEFAKQLLLKNDYVLGVARGNPDSLQAAISNVAAIGISLNPALAFAYLVPRKVNNKPAICLDISYRGLIKLATDTGIIKAMKAELVYQNDTFKYKGFHEKPEFSANPFGDRGELQGAYAMALLTDGNVLVEVMTIGEINKIRDDSEAYKAALSKGEDSWQFKGNVWVKYYTEMCKKTVIKRAYKTLPTSKGTEILGKAIDVINEHEGLEFKEETVEELYYTEEERAEYERCIKESDYFNLFCLIRSLSFDGQNQLFKLCEPEPPKGKKGEFKARRKEALANAELEVDAALNSLTEALADGDDGAAQEILAECSTWTVDFMVSRLSTEQAMQLNELAAAA